MPMVYWHQSTSDDVELWEFQRSIDGTNWEWVQGVSSAGNCATCFEAELYEDGVPAYYRARAVGFDQQQSEWSAAITVPEHDTMVGITVGIIFLLYLFIHKTSFKKGMTMKKQGYIDRDAERVSEKNLPETEAMRIERLAGVKGVQTADDRARESRGMKKKSSGTGKGSYGFTHGKG